MTDNQAKKLSRRHVVKSMRFEFSNTLLACYDGTAQVGRLLCMDKLIFVVTAVHEERATCSVKWVGGRELEHGEIATHYIKLDNFIRINGVAYDEARVYAAPHDGRNRTMLGLVADPSLNSLS